MRGLGCVALAFAAALVLGLAGPTRAADGVPFQTNGTAQGSSLGGNKVAVDGSGSGNVVGSYTTHTESKVKGNGDAIGSGTLTTANGDTLTYVNVTHLDADGVRRGTFTITGGTGKFANASGGGTMEAVPQGNGVFAVSRDGTISY